MEQSVKALERALFLLKILNFAPDLSLSIGELCNKCSFSLDECFQSINAVTTLSPGLLSIDKEFCRLNRALEFLDADGIYQRVLGHGRVEVVPCLGSTNTVMLTKAKDLACGDALFAEIQCAGRGRRGGRWDAGICTNITVSVAWRFQNIKKIAGLSCAVGLCSCKALQEYTNKTVTVKWPNDIYLEKGKLGGILIEFCNVGKSVVAVIGLGVNISGITSNEESGYERACLVVDVKQNLRNEVAVALVNAIRSCCSHFEEEGLEPLLEDYAKCDRLAGHFVRIIDGNRVYEGKVLGIDHVGNIQLNNNGECLNVAAGHVEYLD